MINPKKTESLTHNNKSIDNTNITKNYNILTSEYLIIAIIVCIITLSFFIELPRRNPQAFFNLSFVVLMWYLLNIFNIIQKSVNNIYSVKLGHIFGFIITLFLVYGFVYYALFNLKPNSFNGTILLDRDKPLEFGTYFDMIYFTMSTFSTVGFGDITPASRLARGIVMTQFVVGFALVAILLSPAVN